jgi:uncharacterized protein
VLKRILLAFVAAVAGLGAADFAALQPQGYVSDFANVVDPATRAQLEAYCQNVQQATGAQMALVTLPTLDGEPVEDVANLLYRKWGVGQKGTNEGVLVLFVINDHRTRVEVGYGLEPVIPDGYVGGILRSLRPSLRQGDYSQALADAAQQIGARVAAAKNVVISTQAPRRQTRPRAEGLPIGPIVIVVILLVVFLISRAGRIGGGPGGGGGGIGDVLTGMLLGSLISGGRSPRTGSGGGFGGYDSGDSFGGFGGGDSGGGGASGDW